MAARRWTEQELLDALEVMMACSSAEEERERLGIDADLHRRMRSSMRSRGMRVPSRASGNPHPRAYDYEARQKRRGPRDLCRETIEFDQWMSRPFRSGRHVLIDFLKHVRARLRRG